MKKRMITFLILTCICISLCGCGKESATPVNTPEPVVLVQVAATPTPAPDGKPIALPTATSESSGLYSFTLRNGQRYVVDRYGQYVPDYAMDENGNIVDGEGNLIVLAENTTAYTPIRNMYFGQDSYQLTAEVIVADPDASQHFSNGVIELYCTPANATNGVICVSSDSDAVVEIKPNRNARIVQVDEELLRDGEIAMRPDDMTQPVMIYVRLLSSEAPTASIFVRSIDGASEAACVVTIEVNTVSRPETNTTGTTGGAVTAPRASASPVPTPLVAPESGVNEFVNASGNNANHIHTFHTRVIAPTTSSKGYTLYTCSVCGYSYQDDFTSKLPATGE